MPFHTTNGLYQYLAILLTIDLFGQRIIDIITFTGTISVLILKSGEIRIGKSWMSMDRNSQYIIALIKYILLAVSVVVVNVKDQQPGNIYSDNGLLLPPN